MGSGDPTVIVAGGGFSFDWGLIQPAVAKTTRICTYDPSGTAWSDTPPTLLQNKSSMPTCVDRVTELHTLLGKAEVSGPYILVGFSIGGLYARLYAAEYPQSVAGMVIVDHAFIDIVDPTPTPAPADPNNSPPILISSTPITLGLEDDENFAKLPQRDQDLHTWAMSHNPIRPTAEMAAECVATLDTKVKQTSYPLGSIPLVVIRTANELPAYQKLQSELLLLSRISQLVVASKSSHMVIIDQPELVVSSILQLVNQQRNTRSLNAIRAR